MGNVYTLTFDHEPTMPELKVDIARRLHEELSDLKDTYLKTGREEKIQKRLQTVLRKLPKTYEKGLLATMAKPAVSYTINKNSRKKKNKSAEIGGTR